MASIDSLPYYDAELDRVPGLRARVEKEIAAELAKAGRSKDTSNVPPIPDLYQSNPLLLDSLNRASTSSTTTKNEGEGIDTKRYTIPIPSSLQAKSSEWQSSLDTAEFTLEHTKLRNFNVELLGKYGGNKWRIENFLLEQDIKRIEKELETIRSRTEDVNRSRKSKQTEAGNQLNSLELRWQSLVSGNMQLEIANFALESELQALRQREDELKRRIQE